MPLVQIKFGSVCASMSVGTGEVPVNLTACNASDDRQVGFGMRNQGFMVASAAHAQHEHRCA